jgi:hypothetical protein
MGVKTTNFLLDAGTAARVDSDHDNQPRGWAGNGI